ncbi:response regulator [Pseudomonas sp. S2_C03]
MNKKELASLQGDVIVIEDDPTLRVLMSTVLEEFGVPSISFASADDAFNYLQRTEKQCPLIITDYGLPGRLSGADFIRDVHEQWSYVPAILVSGYGLEPVVVPPSTLYLEKPWSIDDLEAAIATVLNSPEQNCDR